MTNPYENRLHQIEILLHAYNKEDKERYTEEITALHEERKTILEQIGDTLWQQYE